MSNTQEDGGVNDLLIWAIIVPIGLIVFCCVCCKMYGQNGGGSRRRMRSLIDQEAVDFVEPKAWHCL